MDSIPVDLHGAGLAGAPLYLGGVFHVEHVRDGVVIDTWQHGNVVTDEGINHSLNVIFNGATQVGQWSGRCRLMVEMVKRTRATG